MQRLHVSRAPLEAVTLCSFGKDYSAVKLGKCAELDALKRADRIFLSRAMDKQCVRQLLPDLTTQYRVRAVFVALVDWAELTPLQALTVDHRGTRRVARPACPPLAVATSSLANDSTLGRSHWQAL